MNAKAWLATAALLSTGIAQATCYTVYKADGTLIQEGSVAPVNLALQIGDSVPEKFGPGATMTVSDLGLYCKDRRAATEAPASVRPEEPKKADKAGATEKVAARQPATEAAR